MRYSEKILEANGISVETIDLSEVLGRIQKLGHRQIQSCRVIVGLAIAKKGIRCYQLPDTAIQRDGSCRIGIGIVKQTLGLRSTGKAHLG